jgi:hypothetical protein
MQGSRLDIHSGTAIPGSVLPLTKRIPKHAGITATLGGHGFNRAISSKPIPALAAEGVMSRGRTLSAGAWVPHHLRFSKGAGLDATSIEIA